MLFRFHERGADGTILDWILDLLSNIYYHTRSTAMNIAIYYNPIGIMQENNKEE